MGRGGIAKGRRGDLGIYVQKEGGAGLFLAGWRRGGAVLFPLVGCALRVRVKQAFRCWDARRLDGVVGATGGHAAGWGSLAIFDQKEAWLGSPMADCGVARGLVGGGPRGGFAISFSVVPD